MYFDFGKVSTEAITKHLLSSGFPDQTPFNIERFLKQFSSVFADDKENQKQSFLSLHVNDKVDLLIQLADYLSRAVVVAGRQSQTKIDQVQQDKIVTMRKNKDLTRIIEEQEKAKKGIDVANFIKVNKAVTKVQAWVRMINVRSKLKQERDRIKSQKGATVEPNMKLMAEFVRILKTRRMTPEDFFRAIDKSLSGKITVELFIEVVLSRSLVANKQHATRMAFIIDEDISGEITMTELQRTLLSFGFPVEQSCLVATQSNTLSMEQFSLLKIYEQLAKRQIEAHELFSAIDIDNNMNVSCDELIKFMKSLINGVTADANNPTKIILDKDIRFFMAYMDVDRNNFISKGEFLKQYSKLDGMAKKLYPLYKQALQNQIQSSGDTVTEQISQSERDTMNIVSKMQKDGIYLTHFFNQLPNLVDQSATLSKEFDSRLIKLGVLLKQFQVSYPSLSLDEIRSLLKWAKVQAGGKYDYLELQSLITRFINSDLETNSSLYQTLKVIAQNLRQKEVTPDVFVSRSFLDKQPVINFHQFNQVFSDLFQLSQESIVELFSSFLVEPAQQELLKQDLVDVLSSYYFDDSNPMNQDVKISLRNITDFIKDFDTSLPVSHRQRKVKLALLMSKKLTERKLQPMNVYKLAQSNAIQVTKESIVRAFEKLVPTVSGDLVSEVWSKEMYTSKEEFMSEIQLAVQDSQGDKTGNTQQIDKAQLIKKLDEALLGIRVSPSLVFQEADVDRDGIVVIKELGDVLVRLGIKLDLVTLSKIFKEIDVDGSGTIEQSEFFQLFKSTRAPESVKKQLVAVTAISREYLLPTKYNMAKLTRTTNLLSDTNQSFKLTNEIYDVFEEIEVLTSIKETLGLVAIDHRLMIDLRELSTYLKIKGVTIQSLVKLYSILDTRYQGTILLPQLLSLYEQFKPSISVSKVEYNLICKIIKMSGALSVQEFFVKNSKNLQASSTHLTKNAIETDFQSLFKLPLSICGQLYEIVKSKNSIGLNMLQNQHMYQFLQNIYDQIYPSDQPLANLSNQVFIQEVKNKPQKEIVESKEELTRQDLKDLFKRLLGNEKGAISLKKIFQTKYQSVKGVKKITFEDAFKVLAEEHKVLTLNEVKMLYQFVIKAEEQPMRRSITHIEMCEVIGSIEQQVMQSEIKDITAKMEAKLGNQGFIEFIISKVSLVQQGSISKYQLSSYLIQVFCPALDNPNTWSVQPFEIRLILNYLDSENKQLIEIVSLQEYFRLYSKEKQISALLFFKYFAFLLDVQNANQATSILLKHTDIQLKPTDPISKQFAQVIRKYFPNLASKDEYLMDLHDFISGKLSSSDHSLVSIMAYLYFQVDLLRATVKPDDRYKLRNNKELLNSVVLEFQRSKPNYPIYKILDTLPFTDDKQIIPELGLTNHLKKIYQYADQTKVKLFVTLCDVNGDSRIDISEICTILKEIDGGQTTADKVAANLAQIMVSTNEPLDEFLEMHQIDPRLQQGPLAFMDFAEFVMNIFRISKYECYLMFKLLTNASVNNTSLDRFKQLIMKQMQAIDSKIGKQKQDNQKAEDNINQFKQMMANKMQSMLQAKALLNIREKGQITEMVTPQPSTLKLRSVEILKLFRDNFEDISSVGQIKQACIKILKLKKASSSIRSRLFTRRACEMQDLYFELGRPDPKITDSDRLAQGINMTESEKVLLSVLSMQQVDRTYECNVHRFKMLIERLKPTSALDFQMLHNLIKQRYTQVVDLLLDDFLTVNDIISKVKEFSEQNPIKELQIRDPISLDELVSIIEKVYAPIKFRKPEIQFMEKELGGATQISFAKIKVLLAQCGIKCFQQSQLTTVFVSLEQAKEGLSLIKELLEKHSYVDLNFDLIQNSVWQIVNSFDKNFSSRVSSMHKNQTLIDSITQLNADQVDDRDHIANLIVYQDPPEAKLPFMIVKIDSNFVVCDQTLPFTSDNQAQFSFQRNHSKVPYIEKALAVYLKGYSKLSNLHDIRRIFQLLNLDQIEPFVMDPKKQKILQSYQDLLKQYFGPAVMRHLHFKMPQKTLDSELLVKGLEKDRVYAILGLIQLKKDSPDQIHPHCLSVVYNPYLNEDPRKSGEIWSKQFLRDTKKNQKYIDTIKKGFGQEVYNSLIEPSGNLYLYDFIDILQEFALIIFNSASNHEHTLHLLYKLDQNQDPDYQQFSDAMTFSDTINEIVYLVEIPEKSEKECFSLMTFDPSDDSDSTFTMTYLSNSYPFSSALCGRLFTKTLMLPTGTQLKFKVTRSTSIKVEEESVVLKVHTKKADNVKVRQFNVAEIVEIEEKKKQIEQEIQKLEKSIEESKAAPKKDEESEYEYEEEVDNEFERADEEVKLE